MPILTLQRRIREAGRIRGGDRKGAKGPGRKLLTPRFSSHDQSVVDAAARLFGGEVKPWDNDGRPEFDVIIKAASIDVIVPPTGLAFSQYFETWSGGGCTRRCDGVRELLSEQPCLCDPEDRECKPTTRLSLIVPDLETFGLFRLESHGFNAAEELSGVVELAAAMSAQGQYLPATLHFEPREKRKPGKPIQKFVVPVLDLKVPMRRFMEVVSAGVGAPALGAGEQVAMLPASPAALAAAPEPGFIPIPPGPDQAGAPVSVQIDAAREERDQARRSNAAEPIRATGMPLRPVAAEVIENIDDDEDQAVLATSTDGESAPSGSSPDSPSASPGGEPTAADRTAAAAGDGDSVTPSPHAAEERHAAASPPDGSPSATARARRIAIRCREIGINTDDERHRLIGLLTHGRTTSGKQLDDVEYALVTETLARIGRHELRLITGVDGALRLEDVDAPAPGTGPDDPAWWNDERWASFAKQHGKSKAAVLRKAREIASELSDPPVAAPRVFAEWDDGRVSAAVRDWIEEQAA